MDNQVVLLFNKMDKLKTQKERNALQKQIPLLSKTYKWIRQMYFVSAETKSGLEPLNDMVVNFLKEQIDFKSSN
jgi:GTP-binding protein